jgi:hypothetical protein
MPDLPENVNIHLSSSGFQPPPRQDMHLSSPEENDPDQFLKKAKRLVFDVIWASDEDDGPNELEIYVVWFSKTLQNWKAMLSTNIPDGRYYEVTYNGDKEESYVDTYYKIENTRIPDDPDAAGYDKQTDSVEEFDAGDEGFRIPIPDSSILDTETTDEGVIVTIKLPADFPREFLGDPVKGVSISDPNTTPN